jgi:para-aminobenzoate synthetase component 1
MRRQSKRFEVSDAEKFLRSILFYGSRQKDFCLLNSNRAAYPVADKYSSYDLIAGIGSICELKNAGDSFESLRSFHEENSDWLFGFLSYDLKCETANLPSGNYDGIGFPLIHFFRPRFVLTLQKNVCEVFFAPELDDAQSVNELMVELNSHSVNGRTDAEQKQSYVEIRKRVSREEYLADVAKIHSHIQRGDVYELNYCQEFYAEDAIINPVETYLRMNLFSPMPFSGFLKCHDKYLMCASPERFLKKAGTKIISQPIKGTIARMRNEEEDIVQKMTLLNDRKEQAENVMIVDLVRNDLSHTAKKGSVKVEEMSGIYSFANLHQMISTVTSELRDDVHWTETIRKAFPMGSMTGAPKIRAMQLIEQFEKTRRGLFSGSFGYITADGDFDFNVVIRSLLYNEASRYLSYMAGSAITAMSNPEKEYEECLLKASALNNIFPEQKKPGYMAPIHA